MSRTTAGTLGHQGCAVSLMAGGLFVVVALGVLAVPVAFIAYGVYGAVTQDRDLRAARPVAATMVSSQVVKSGGRQEPRRVPVVAFRYEVGGRQYQSNHSMLFSERGLPDGVTAEQVVAARPPGAAVEAWYVPDEPGRAFLLKAYTEGPYVLIYVGLAALALVQGLGVGYLLYPTAAAGLPPGRGWQPLAMRRPLRARLAVNLIQGAVYLSVWGWAAWHYFTRVPGPHGVAAHLIIPAFSLPGLWYVVAGASAHVTRRAVSDARVAVRKEGLCVGGKAEVRVEQDLLGDAMPERVRVGLVCEKATGSGKQTETTVHWQAWAEPEVRPTGGQRRGPSGRSLAFTETFVLPADVPATIAAGDPRFAWKVIVEMALPGCPDYREAFDLHVPPAGDASGKKRGRHKKR